MAAGDPERLSAAHSGDERLLCPPLRLAITTTGAAADYRCALISSLDSACSAYLFSQNVIHYKRQQITSIPVILQVAGALAALTHPSHLLV
ncbi:hypothetical protein DYD83_05900 [Dickeya fangzhongdai]|uniref:Uncharacterized protein n=1 Tax=Dickeya fangzhongdai TaxID=1778540 RepID=A0A2K8QJ91_9GAMM|nr:hypothetical protein CVE23_05855 [Dickeya fangzhongdai]QOH46974.1 hypothetical protein DYD82_05900 [Dickeya fangzhongdai]QOH51279.1 hypothetical protein DYD83_05900 [Dickeya fangzhongdai]